KNLDIKLLFEVDTSKKVCIVVLGMHRSRTSLISGVLTQMGVYPGAELLSPQKDNPKGFYENRLVVEFNDNRLLPLLGSAWDSVEPIDWQKLKGYREQLEAEAERIISETYKEANLILLKDPRLCVLLPFWEDIFTKLDIEIRPLLVFRNPIEVAHSLFYRNGFSITKSLLLWAKHVLYSEFYTRKYRRGFLNTTDFIRDPFTLVEVLESMGIRLRKGVDKQSVQNIIKSFVDENLIHYNLPSKTHFEDLPDFVRLPFLYLEKIATGELKFKDDLESKFDIWRSEYEEFVKSYFVNTVSKPSQKVIFQVFFDYGDGFSEENSLRIELPPKKGTNSIDLNLPANVKQFRIDPICGFGCIIRILDFYIGNKSTGKKVYLENSIESNADFIYGREYTFLHDDPQIIINQNIMCSDNYDHFHISFEYLEIFSPVHNQVRDRLNKYKTDLQFNLQHKENTISELQNNLSHLQTQLDSLSSEKERLLEEIARKEEEKNSLQRELEEKNGLISELQNNLSSLEQEFKKIMDYSTQLQGQLNDLTSEKERLLEEIARKEEEKNSLQRELQEKKGLISELQREVETLSAEKGRLIFMLYRLTNRPNAFEIMVRKYYSKVKKLFRKWRG
ncbi:MAG: hypothetical protein QXS69_03420, partial [Candidatus Aenigmatarchaeota archaeon]